MINRKYMNWDGWAVKRKVQFNQSINKSINQTKSLFWLWKSIYSATRSRWVEFQFFWLRSLAGFIVLTCRVQSDEGQNLDFHKKSDFLPGFPLHIGPPWAGWSEIKEHKLLLQSATANIQVSQQAPPLYSVSEQQTDCSGASLSKWSLIKVSLPAPLFLHL